MTSLTPEPLVRFEDVSVSYWLRQGIFKRKKHYALRNVSFEIYPGDSLGVIGRNGSGKSTLLRLLAGVMIPDEGRIIKRDDLRVSLLSLQLGFVNYLSGRENVILSGTILGMPKREIAAKMDDIIAFSELGEFINQPIATYSAGMRARLGFAVSFQLHPDVLLVDEVLGVGDGEFRIKAVREMKDRIKMEDSTVLFVSHSMGEVRELCNRAIWIDKGHLMQSGDTSAVLHAYESTMVTHEISEFRELIARGTPFFIRKQGLTRVHAIQNRKMFPVSPDELRSLGGRYEDIKVISEVVFDIVSEECE